MSSLLRSSTKYSRFAVGFAKNTIFSAPKLGDGTLVNNAYLYAKTSAQGLPSASQKAIHQIHAEFDGGLDSSLKRIEKDAKRKGRISSSDVQELIEEMQSCNSTTSQQSLKIIRCCGRLVPDELPEVRTKMVQDVWNTLIERNIDMDISHYNALLKVYLVNEHKFSPTDFLNMLETRRIEANHVTYQRLIARYCQDGDIEGALKILEYMKEKKIGVNENVFNALIKGHSESGDMESARDVLKVMARGGMQPTVDTYTALMCGYAKEGDIDKINELVNECITKELGIQDQHYLEVIYDLAINGHDQQVPLLLSSMIKTRNFNVEAYDTILRLTNKGKEDVAFLVLKAMKPAVDEEGKIQQSGGFFIAHMVKVGRPAANIVAICDKLETQELYEGALLMATRVSLEETNENLAFDLLAVLKERGIDIRPHYFWPLLAACRGNCKNVLRIMKKINDLGVSINNETIRDYVVPNLKGSSSDILRMLRETNVSIGVAASSLVHSLLLQGDIKEAADISGRISAYYPPELKRPLTTALYRTGDIESYVRTLRNFYENFERKNFVKESQEEESESSLKTIDKAEETSKFILDLIHNRRAFETHIEAVLEAVAAEGLSISPSAADRLEDKLGEKLTPKISNLLGKLSSGELTPGPLPKRTPPYTPTNLMNIAQLERLISNLDAKGVDTSSHKRQLLGLYCREKDLTKIESLLEELQKNEFTYTAGIYAQLIDAYAYHNNLEKTLEYMDKIKEMDKDFKLDDIKMVRIVQVLMKHDRLDQALEMIEALPPGRDQVDHSYAYRGLVWRFFNSLAEEGRAEDLEKVFDLFVQKELVVEVNNVLLGPLIKVHLVKGDVDKALEKFEWCVEKYRATPWKNELASKLIQAEQADKLQKLTDLSTSVHGEINSLYDLVFTFVECGRIRQARKILETPGLQNRPQRINHACERYHNEGMVTSLEGLKDATKNLNHIDRSDIYYQLLLSYIKQQEPDKALELWVQMQEEDMAPTTQFLSTLGGFLEKCGVKVPFVMPTEVPPIVSGGEGQTNKRVSFSARTTGRTAAGLKQKLKANDLDGALSLYTKKPESFSVNESSLLIEKLLQSDRTGEALNITIDQLQNKTEPISRVIKFLLNKLATAGDVESIESLGAVLTHETKKNVSFDNRLCHANLMAGKAETYLNKLEEDIDQAQDDSEVKAIGEKFPRGGAYGILERHPELTEKFESMAIKYVNKGIVAPLNVLWTIYFIDGNEVKTKEMWDKYLKDAPRIMFQRIVHKAREQKDVVLIRKLIDHLKISNVTEGAIGNAYSCLLDVLHQHADKHADIIPAFESALKDVGLDRINRTAILRVKEVHDNMGKPFNHQIPPKTRKNTAASSTDDH